MTDLGIQLSQMYLSPFDHIIGIIGDAGAGKSLLIKGMFPGIDLTNDDEGVNIRPLPLLSEDLTDPFAPHTYHLDIRFESAFTQMHELAEAILEAANNGKMVIVEHFDLIYPLLHRNADLLVGIGEEIIITRPSMFGPLPENIASPSGPYFPGGVKPVSIWVEDKWFRTGPGGTGFAKCGGNYAASLLGEYTGIDHGCQQVCFVDAATKTYLEELGGMNMMVVHKDGHVETPSLTGNILPGVTRRSLIQLIQDNGHDVVETMIALDQLLEDIKSGEVTEVFACGTAAIITPIGRFKSEKFDVTVADGGSGEFTLALRNQLLGIQLGEIEDPHNWMWKVC